MYLGSPFAAYNTHIYNCNKTTTKDAFVAALHWHGTAWNNNRLPESDLNSYLDL